ncbi:efflux RND transporter periplasmic adaptor subunit [soil metagenome]
MRLHLMVTLAVLSASLATACSPGSEDAGAGGPGGPGGPPGGMQLPVEAVTLRLEPLEAGLATVGSLRADESVTIRPEVAGRITRIQFQEGGRVERGQPLFNLDAATAGAALNEAQANLASSRSAVARAGELVGERLIARADYDKLRAQRAVDEARLSSARTAMGKMSLRAPFAGQIGLRSVSVGEYVNAGQDLVTLVRLDPIQVDFSMPETALASLRTGQAIRVEVDAYPGERFGGEVVAIDPVIDPVSRSVRLRAQVANPDFKLRPGQFARVLLQPRGAQQALLVPEQALMQTGDERFVYTVVDGQARRSVVQTGTRVPGKVEIRSGLSAGDVVIIAGQGKPMMRDGMPVQVLPVDDGAGARAAAAQPAQAPAAKAANDPDDTAETAQGSGRTP